MGGKEGPPPRLLQEECGKDQRYFEHEYEMPSETELLEWGIGAPR